MVFTCKVPHVKLSYEHIIQNSCTVLPLHDEMFADLAHCG